MAKRGSTNRGKARKSSETRCDSARANDETRISLPLSILQRDLVRSAAATQGQGIADYCRHAVMIQSIRDVVKSLKAQKPLIIPKQHATPHDGHNARVIVASALNQAPNHAAITSLAADLASLLSAE